MSTWRIFGAMARSGGGGHALRILAAGIASACSTAWGVAWAQVVPSWPPLSSADVAALFDASPKSPSPVLGCWRSMSGGADKSVRAIAARSGELGVGGSFTNIGGVAAKRLARRSVNGVWSELGGGIVGPGVEALAISRAGDVIVGGWFQSAGTTPVQNIALWDGASEVWLDMNGGITLPVWAVTALPDGGVVAGGQFGMAGGVPAAMVARWDSGAGWSALGSGLQPYKGTPSGAYVLCPLASKGLLVGGLFESAGGKVANSVALWDGVGWRPLDAGVNGWVQSLAEAADGTIYVGGSFTAASGMPALRIARWNGHVWSALGAGGIGGGSVTAITLQPGGGLIVAGSFARAGGQSVNNIAGWSGTAWFALGLGVNGVVRGTALLDDDRVAIVGEFTEAGGLASPRLAEWAVCLADCDQDCAATIDDLMCFQVLFAAGHPGADCDGNGTLNSDDFVCFQALFAIGC